MILDNPMTLPVYGPSLEALFPDTTLWDIRDDWDLFAYAYERGLIAEIIEPELTTDDPEDPIEAFEAMPEKEAATLIERWIERNLMISDYLDWRKENL